MAKKGRLDPTIEHIRGRQRNARPQPTSTPKKRRIARSAKSVKKKGKK